MGNPISSSILYNIPLFRGDIYIVKACDVCVVLYNAFISTDKSIGKYGISHTIHLQLTE